MKKIFVVIAVALLFSVTTVPAHADDAQQNPAKEEVTTAVVPSWWPANLERAKADAAKSDPKAEFYLGWVYKEGRGVPKDDREAAKWFRKAAEQGYADAQTNLGSLYWQGLGVPKDYGNAVKWFRKAAEQGNVGGEANLGIAYVNGSGVPQNYNEAAKWSMRAAEQGASLAQWNLGYLYSQGKGVPRDLVKAYIWLSLAADQGIEKAKQNRDETAQYLTPEQKTEAGKQLQEKRATVHPASDYAP